MLKCVSLQTLQRAALISPGRDFPGLREEEWACTSDPFRRASLGPTRLRHSPQPGELMGLCGGNNLSTKAVGWSSRSVGMSLGPPHAQDNRLRFWATPPGLSTSSCTAHIFHVIAGVAACKLLLSPHFQVVSGGAWGGDEGEVGACEWIST